MILLDGKKLAEKIRKNLKEQVSALEKKPVLAMVMVGDNTASEIYVRNKNKACAEIGITPRKILLPESTTEAELMSQLQALNDDDAVTAIMLQLPLPKHINRYAAMAKIRPEKDADCLCPFNFGGFFQKGEADFPIGPATPVGIVRLLEEYNVQIEKKYAVLIGYSDIVGKPLSELLVARGATVTVCHQKTQDMKSLTRAADILVSATGVRHLVTEDMVKNGAVVVDVGINRDGKKLSGDVDFERVSRKSSFITPVPGGVGPMTVAILMENTVRLATIEQKRNRERAGAETAGSAEGAKAPNEIEKEFLPLLERLDTQCSVMNDLKARSAKAETKYEMAEKAKKEAVTAVEKMFEEITVNKPSAWMEQKEDYSRELEGILDDVKAQIEKKAAGIKQYDLEIDGDSFKPLLKREKFEIPTEYDDNYDLCKNAIENEIEENEKEIQELEARDREMENSVAKVEDDISAIRKKIDEWQNWLGTARKFDVDYEEDVEDLHLAAAKYFEVEKEEFLSQFRK